MKKLGSRWWVGLRWAVVGQRLEQSPVHVIGINGGNFCSQTFKMQESFAGFRSRRLSNVLVFCVKELIFRHYVKKFSCTQFLCIAISRSRCTSVCGSNYLKDGVNAGFQIQLAVIASLQTAPRISHLRLFIWFNLKCKHFLPKHYR